MKYRYKLQPRMLSDYQSTMRVLESVVEVSTPVHVKGKGVFEEWVPVPELSRSWAPASTIEQIESALRDEITAYDHNLARTELIGQWFEFDPNNPR